MLEIIKEAFLIVDWLNAKSLIRTGRAFKWALHDEHEPDYEDGLEDRSLRIALASDYSHTFRQNTVNRGRYD